MKYLIVVLFSFFMNNECGQKDQGGTILKSVTYQAATRGSKYECTVAKDGIRVISSGIKANSSQDNISEKDWGDIKKMIKKLDLSKIVDLEAPSSKSHTDRALIGSLQVVVGDVVYESSTFDDGNPPEELKPLIDKISALAETVE